MVLKDPVFEQLINKATGLELNVIREAFKCDDLGLLRTVYDSVLESVAKREF